MKKAGFGWETVETLLARLMKTGQVDAGPGRKAGTSLYFVVGEPSSDSETSTSRTIRWPLRIW